MADTNLLTPVEIEIARLLLECILELLAEDQKKEKLKEPVKWSSESKKDYSGVRS